RGRRSAEYEGYTAPPPVLPQGEGNPDLDERKRLNLLDTYYRGTLFGAARFALLNMLNKLPDDGVGPATRRVRDEFRKEYHQLVADIERYERMPRFQNPSEFGAAALAQFGGGILSPEHLGGARAKVRTW